MADYGSYRSKGYQRQDPYRVGSSYGSNGSSGYSRELPGTYNLRSRELERADRQLQFRTYGRVYNAYPVHYEDTLKQFKKALHGNLEGFITETKEERQIGRDHARANKSFQRTKQEHEELKSGKRSEGDNVLKSLEETRKKEKTRAQYESQTDSRVRNVRAAIKEEKQYRDNKRQIDQRKDKIRSETKEYEEQTQRIRQHQKEQREKLFGDEEPAAPPRARKGQVEEEDAYSRRRGGEVHVHVDVDVDVEEGEEERRGVREEVREEEVGLHVEGGEEHPQLGEEVSLQQLETSPSTGGQPADLDLDLDHPQASPEATTQEEKEHDNEEVPQTEEAAAEQEAFTPTPDQPHPTEQKEATEEETPALPNAHDEEVPPQPEEAPAEQEAFTPTPDQADQGPTGEDPSIHLEEPPPPQPDELPTELASIDIQLEQN